MRIDHKFPVLVEEEDPFLGFCFGQGKQSVLGFWHSQGKRLCFRKATSYDATLPPLWRISGRFSAQSKSYWMLLLSSWTPYRHQKFQKNGRSQGLWKTFCNISISHSWQWQYTSCSSLQASIKVEPSGLCGNSRKPPASAPSSLANHPGSI